MRVPVYCAHPMSMRYENTINKVCCVCFCDWVNIENMPKIQIAYVEIPEGIGKVIGSIKF